MPNFHISGYKENDFNSHKFIGQDKKPVSIEGHKYYIEYRLDKGVAEPGELKIRRNIQDALKKIGGNVIFDDNFNKTSTIVLQKEGKETWVEVRSYNNMYRLTIVEKEIMKQEVEANAEAMGNDINTTGHVSIYGIYFDTGKAEIKPESDAAIAEIAKAPQEQWRPEGICRRPYGQCGLLRFQYEAIEGPRRRGDKFLVSETRHSLSALNALWRGISFTRQIKRHRGGKGEEPACRIGQAVTRKSRGLRMLSPPTDFRPAVCLPET